MAVTMTEIKNLLSERSIKYYIDDCGNKLLLPYSINRQQINIHLRLYDDGKFLFMGIPEFLFMDRPLNREQSYEKMLMLNDRLKIGKLSLSDDKESVWLEAGLPVEDNDVTARQIRRIIGTLTSTCRKERASLQHFIDTCVDSKEEMEDIVRKLLSNPVSEDAAELIDDASEEVAIDEIDIDE